MSRTPCTVEGSATLVNAHGLHARPISLLVNLVGRYRSKVEVSCEGRTADGSSILELMSLGAGPGKTLSFRVEGEDATDLLRSLLLLIESGFGDSPG